MLQTIIEVDKKDEVEKNQETCQVKQIVIILDQNESQKIDLISRILDFELR